jgi:hypothetical protein
MSAIGASFAFAKATKSRKFLRREVHEGFNFDEPVGLPFTLLAAVQ